jgi:ubiquinone/menaquinone biosynthesis C-methylase UbiE
LNNHYKYYSDVLKYEATKYGRAFGRFLKSFEQRAFVGLVCKQKLTIDIGCGTGKFLPFLSDNSICADNSLEMIKFSKTNSANNKLQFVVCDAHFLPFQSKSIEQIISSRCLMHLKFPEKAIKEFSRVANKNIIFDFPNSWSLSLYHMLWRKIVHKFNPKSQIYKTFTLHQIELYYKKVGFFLEKKIAFFFIPIAIHRLINNNKITMTIESFFQKIKFVTNFSTYIVVKIKTNSN